jgi:hypothetical protein
MFLAPLQNTAVSAEFCLFSRRGMFLGNAGLNSDHQIRMGVGIYAKTIRMFSIIGKQRDDKES